jgi:hypothetical protein
MNTLSTGSGTVRHKHADRGYDLYETPSIAVEALLENTFISKQFAVYEPACGRGAISKVLIDNGYEVYSSDINPEYPGATQENFLTRTEPFGFPYSTVITNPPYKHAQAFVEKSLELGAGRVFMLLRLAFLESERRSGILDSGHLRTVYPFKKRLPMMHRDGWTGNKASSAIPFAWFEWRQNTVPETVMRRI